MSELEELKARLNELEQDEFYTEMIDHWDESDYKRIDRIHKEQKEIKEKIKELENKKC